MEFFESAFWTGFLWPLIIMIAESVLALIGVREIRVIQHYERAPKHQSSHQERDRNSVQADAAGLERDELIVLGHNAERDQRSHQGGQRGELVKQVTGEIDEIAEDFEQPGAMLRNVVQELEKREYLEEQNEANGQK